MGNKKYFFTIQRKDGSWTVKSNGTRKATVIYSSKEDAWKETKRLARGASSIAILREKDGEIRIQNTYELELNQ
jgi:hypothetical protein